MIDLFQIIGEPIIELDAHHERRNSDCEIVCEVQDLEKASESNKKSDFSCPICMESLSTIVDDVKNSIVSTDCGHVFCERCLTTALSRSSKKSCPVCSIRLLSRKPFHKLYL